MVRTWALGFGGIAGLAFWYLVFWPHVSHLIDENVGWAGSRLGIFELIACVVVSGACFLTLGEKLGLIPPEEQIEKDNLPLTLFSTYERDSEPASPAAPAKVASRGLTGDVAHRTVKTLDDAFTVYENRDLNSTTLARLPTGTEVRLGEALIVEGREWVNVTLPNGDGGYALGPNIRGHSA